MRGTVAALVPLLLGASSALAWDDIPSAADADLFVNCVSTAEDGGGSGYGCISEVTRNCQENPDYANAQATAACIRKETVLWDRMLNDRYERLMAVLDAPRRSRLKATQRSWIALRDATCAMEVSLWNGGSEAILAESACLLHETAHRALTLSTFANEVGQ